MFLYVSKNLTGAHFPISGEVFLKKKRAGLNLPKNHWGFDGVVSNDAVSQFLGAFLALPLQNTPVDVLAPLKLPLRVHAYVLTCDGLLSYPGFLFLAHTNCFWNLSWLEFTEIYYMWTIFTVEALIKSTLCNIYNLTETAGNAVCACVLRAMHALNVCACC